ncbi:hypothetical protein, conserved [Leishmania tarentolae]|uniref:PHD-type domain-containing protein n=1 Tax=Leishmania tarentolae TaxID=5689 RepID=A0A640KTA3_LEITA|nr:hypothetical protein, conserved [Leishmania tarentolae]
MPKTVKPVKRVIFGPVTYFSAPLIDASQGPDAYENSRLVDASPLPPRVSTPAAVAILAPETTPCVQHEADRLLGMRKSKEYVAQPRLFLESAVNEPRAALSSVQKTATVVTAGNQKGDDTQDRPPKSFPRVTSETSPITRLESSDDETYDTPQESRSATQHLLPDAARLYSAGPRKSPLSSWEKSPTLSELVSEVDEVLGGFQLTPQGLLAASPSAISRRGSFFSTESTVDHSLTTNSSPPTAMSVANVRKDNAYDTREVGGCADPPLVEGCLLQHRKCGENFPARGFTCHASQFKAESTMALAASKAASGNVNSFFCIFCNADVKCGNAHEAPPLCVSDGIAYHMACALWCPEVYYDIELGTLKGVAEAVHRARLIKCAWCRQLGAAVGCACATCQLSFHAPCAVKARASIDVHAFLLYCPAHRSATRNNRAGDRSEPGDSEAALKRTKTE